MEQDEGIDAKLSSFKSKRLWHFVDKHKHRAAELRIFGTKPSLSLEARTDEAELLRGRIDQITALEGTTRLTLLYSYGQELYPFFGTHYLNYEPDLAVLQALDKSMPTLSTNKIGLDIPGIHTFFGVDLVDFDSKARKFKENKDQYFSATVSRVGEFELNTTLSTPYQFNRTFVAKHDDYVNITFNRDRPYGIAIGYAKKIEDLFNFIFPDTTNQSHFWYFRSRPRRKTNTRVDIFSTVYNDSVSNNKFDKRSDAYNILFQFNDLSNFEEILEKWITHYGDFEEVWEGLKLIKGGNLSQKIRFLTLVAACESFHKSFLSKVTNTQKTTYKARLRKIIDEIQDDPDKKLIQVLGAYGYEPSLSTRIKELEDLSTSLGAEPLDPPLLHKLIQTRHNYIHSLGIRDNTVLSDSEMRKTSAHLTIYLRIALLNLLGFKDNELKEVIKKKVTFKWFHEY